MRKALLVFVSLSVIDVGGNALGFSLFHVRISTEIALAIGAAASLGAVLLPSLVRAWFAAWRGLCSHVWQSFEFRRAWHDFPVPLPLDEREPPEPPGPRFLALDGWASRLFLGPRAGRRNDSPPLIPPSLIVLAPVSSLAVVELTGSFPIWFSVLVLNAPIALFILTLNRMSSFLAEEPLDADLEEAERVHPNQAYWYVRERAWRRLEKSVFKRDMHRCRCCGRGRSELGANESLTCYLDPALGWTRDPAREAWFLTVCSTCKVTVRPSGISEDPLTFRWGT